MCLILFSISSCVSDKSGKSPDFFDDQVTVFEEIRIGIDSTIVNKTWSVDGYIEMKARIDASHSADLIDLEEKKLLVDYLNTSYIPKLIDATKSFLKGACDDRELLQKLNIELRRYRDEDVDQAYRGIVKDYRTATSDIYRIAGWVDHEDGPRKGLDGEILKYTRNHLFDKQRSDQMLAELMKRSNNTFISGCTLVRESVDRNRARLDSHFYEYVNQTIDEYISEGVYAPIDHDNFLALIDNYQSANYLSNNSRVLENAEGLRVKMDQFKMDNE
jgi:hypothetical protein